MILRVFRGKVLAGREQELYRLVRTIGLPAVRRQPGLIAAHYGRRLDPTGDEIVLTTLWADVTSLAAWAGPDSSAPVLFEGEAELLADHGVELFEMMDVTDAEAATSRA